MDAKTGDPFDEVIWDNGKKGLRDIESYEEVREQFFNILVKYKHLLYNKQEPLKIRIPGEALDSRWVDRTGYKSWFEMVHKEIEKHISEISVYGPIFISNLIASGNYQSSILIPFDYFAELYDKVGFWKIFDRNADWTELIEKICYIERFLARIKFGIFARSL